MYAYVNIWSYMVVIQPDGGHNDGYNGGKLDQLPWIP